MPNPHGDFVWYELLTPDAEASAAFYAAAIGWQMRPAQGSDRGYRILRTGAADIAGLMPMPGQPARWLGYISVADVDAAAAAILAAGGREQMPPTDIPGVGRFALLADPHGVPFYVMRGASDAVSTAFAPMQPGHCQWNELTTPDQAAALDFYLGQFGWEKGDAMPMGPLGDYRFLHQQGRMIGAMMNRQPDGPPPAWNFYFGVADIDVAAAAVTSHGGAIYHGPAEVPGGLFSLNACDPQGAPFGLVGPRKG